MKNIDSLLKLSKNNLLLLSLLVSESLSLNLTQISVRLSAPIVMILKI